MDHPKTYHYLNQSSCYELVGVSDAHDYLATRRAMDIVGINAKDQVKVMNNHHLTNEQSKNKKSSQYLSLAQEAIFRVVAAILHLGNISFTKGKDVDSSVPKDDKAKFHLKTAAELLMYESLLLSQ